MKNIPKEKRKQYSRIAFTESEHSHVNEKIVFSFECIDRNEYFNLDRTCQNWSADLFDTLQKVSAIKIKEITSGNYSGKNSTLRIHRHQNAIPPCKVPENILLDDMWQIRISKSKGGIHGIFSENIFYVIWFDPQHNLYPDKNHGGLKKIVPPSTCCKDRDSEIKNLIIKIQELEEDRKFLYSYISDLEQEIKKQG